MKKVLIANRGEIAVRIIRTCKKLGLPAVSVYSDADRGAPHVLAADESVALGGDSAADSYLRIDKILSAAREAGADTVHPGYGFLAENATFAEELANAGIKFVGPSAEVLRLIGDKDSARKLAKSCSVPIPEGYDGSDQSLPALTQAAEKLGFPLLVKAVAGGGGRGMRLITEKKLLKDALESAQREAKAFFGDGRLILEQYLSPARHIEVQLLGDSHGNVVHLFERDCSLQRRYQKVIEESPARNLSEEIRKNLFAAAVKIGISAKLIGAATAEFLVPTGPGREPFYFLEVNPRIQVEHPVTEAVTGIDIVELQLKIARGEKLPLTQKNISSHGHAIEARVCSELPVDGFRPSGGRIAKLSLPNETSSLRLDHALRPGLMIGTNYDSLMLKVIASGKSAEAATKNLSTALENIVIGEVETNLAFLANILGSGIYGGKSVPDTSYLDMHVDELTRPQKESERKALAKEALAGHLRMMFFPASQKGRPRALHIPPLQFKVESRSLGESWVFDVTAADIAPDKLISSTETFVSRSSADAWTMRTIQYLRHYVFQVERLLPWFEKEAAQSHANTVVAPLPGTVLSLDVATGQRVKAGDRLLVIESMKMEHTIRATTDAEVAEIRVARGARVKEGELLIRLTGEES